MMPVNQPIDAMRMRPRQRAELILQLDSHSGKVEPEAERRTTRHTHHGPAVATVDHPSGAAARFIVHPRNLSAKGMAFVHGGFLYPGSRCLILMNTLSGKGRQMPGRLRACRHLTGLAHEISVIFDDAIDLDDFVEKPPVKAKRASAQ